MLKLAGPHMSSRAIDGTKFVPSVEKIPVGIIAAATLALCLSVAVHANAPTRWYKNSVSRHAFFKCCQIVPNRTHCATAVFGDGLWRRIGKAKFLRIVAVSLVRSVDQEVQDRLHRRSQSFFRLDCVTELHLIAV